MSTNSRKEKYKFKEKLKFNTKKNNQQKQIWPNKPFSYCWRNKIPSENINANKINIKAKSPHIAK
jgi:hypothetical protein